MNSKERALRIINHQEADRIAIDFWAVDEALEKLLEHFGFKCKEQLLKEFEVDFRQSPTCFQDLGPLKWDKSDKTVYYNMWGVGKSCKWGGTSIYHPLKDVQTIDDVKDYPWPNPDDIDVDAFVSYCDTFYRDYCIYGGMWGPIFYIGYELMGMENFLITMYTNPELAHYILDKATDFYLEADKRLFEAVRDKMDIFFMADDLGTQENLIISIEMYDEFIGPRTKKIYDQAKNYGYKVMQHSCGAVKKIIPRLLELGLEILNPIQVSAKGMDPYQIKKQFGDKLVLCGSIDTVKTLPFGTKQDVKNEVIERIKTLAPGGGFILNSSQELLPEIPVENIVTMYQTAKHYGYYDSLGEYR